MTLVFMLIFIIFVIIRTVTELVTRLNKKVDALGKRMNRAEYRIDDLNACLEKVENSLQD